jgi:enterochelin esterase-like enzyme
MRGVRVLLFFAAVACTRREDSHPAPFQPAAPHVSASAAVPAGKLAAEERTWSFPQSSVGRMSVVVVVPERAPDERFPVLIAFHGRGETLKGPERGARGWVDDYALGRAAERLAHPPLVADDFEGFVEAPRLDALNRALGAVPYRGLIVVCPYLPDLLSSDDPFAQAPRLATFLVDELIPKINSETPALATPAATGIDGVSLGGRAALSVGLLRPEAFGAVASLQAALEPQNASDLTARAQRAIAKNPGLRLRLLTSSGDYYLATLAAIHGALNAGKVPHDYLVVSGPHDYAFNRGPGALEMLAYHDRVLRGSPPP